MHVGISRKAFVGAAALAALLVAVPVGTASAVPMDFDFSGNFTRDNDVVELMFTLDNPSEVTVFSSSWLSGEPPMGLDPMLGIWDAAGNLIEFQDDGGAEGTESSNGVEYSYGFWDSYYQVNLGPGDYIATVVQYSNFNVSNDLSDGFEHEDNPNFTFDLGYGGASQPYFNGVWDELDPRTSDWEFHLLGVDQASVEPIPEPGTLALLGTGILGLVAVGRLRRRG